MGFVKYFVILSLLMFLESSVLTRGEQEIELDECYSDETSSHDVTDYGAVGDGETDDTKAFEAAWEAACTSDLDENGISVPSGKTFLVSSILFEGPCKPRSISFQILGTIVAPPRSKWATRNVDVWLFFHKVDGLSVMGDGQGQIDGNGDSWWSYGSSMSRPTAMRFSSCNNLQVKGLKYVNSQRNHISINACSSVNIEQLYIVAPETSPNTDGIDVAASTDIDIRDSKMETGDDCIAITGGTSRVNISGIECGPGHGISIGSLGRNGGSDQVQEIAVTNCTFYSTQNGVRIKTWQGGSGFARKITFSNIIFHSTNNPVIIDQHYCPHRTCTEKESAVHISDVTYSGLRGTSASKYPAINFSCSGSVPCTGIQMDDVNILPTDEYQVVSAKCINAQVTQSSSNPLLQCVNQ